MQGSTNLVSMPEPGRAFLLTADQSDPLAATPAKPFPHIEVALCAAGVLGPLERCASRCADAVCERFVIPERTVLEY